MKRSSGPRWRSRRSCSPWAASCCCGGGGAAAAGEPDPRGAARRGGGGRARNVGGNGDRLDHYKDPTFNKDRLRLTLARASGAAGAGHEVRRAVSAPQITFPQRDRALGDDHDLRLRHRRRRKPLGAGQPVTLVMEREEKRRWLLSRRTAGGSPRWSTAAAAGLRRRRGRHSRVIKRPGVLRTPGLFYSSSASAISGSSRSTSRSCAASASRSTFSRNGKPRPVRTTAAGARRCSAEAVRSGAAISAVRRGEEFLPLPAYQLGDRGGQRRRSTRGAPRCCAPSVPYSRWFLSGLAVAPLPPSSGAGGSRPLMSIRMPATSEPYSLLPDARRLGRRPAAMPAISIR